MNFLRFSNAIRDEKDVPLSRKARMGKVRRAKWLHEVGLHIITLAFFAALAWLCLTAIDRLTHKPLSGSPPE